ncbi:ATP-dependent nuclease [Mycobacterium kansasii]
MKLTRIEVKNFRSFGESDIRLTDGMNALVGPNNCGKSNLVRAIRMAFDPKYPFDPAVDVPGQRKFAFPRTTLTFDCRGATSSESTLLRYLRDYEKTVSRSSSSTYAERQHRAIRRYVSWGPRECNPPGVLFRTWRR